MIQLARTVEQLAAQEPAIRTIADAAGVFAAARVEFARVEGQYWRFWPWVEWLFSFSRTMRSEDVAVTERCLHRLSLLGRHDVVQNEMLTAPEGTKLLIEQIQDLHQRLFVFRQRFWNTAL